jgi:hypothetical protein
MTRRIAGRRDVKRSDVREFHESTYQQLEKRTTQTNSSETEMDALKKKVANLEVEVAKQATKLRHF